MKIFEHIKSKLSRIPLEPGVYLMKNDKSRIIYVGKAKKLKNRVSSYFQNSKNLGPKTKSLQLAIADFEYIICKSEEEALILEASLIKKYKPKFNIRLKDDKSYPYIKISKEKFPKVEKTREYKKDKSKYFGPYSNVLAVNKTIDTLLDIFKVRKCKRNMDKKYKKPCLYYHMKKCLAPCIYKDIEEEYSKEVKAIESFLERGNPTLIKSLEEEMKISASELNFEKAALIRDKINALKLSEKKQNISSFIVKDMDLISVSTKAEKTVVMVFFIRGHMFFERELFYLEREYDEEITVIIEQFILQFYSGAAYIPENIEIQIDLENKELYQAWLSKRRKSKVEIRHTKRGERKKLMETAIKNVNDLLEKEYEHEIKKQRKQLEILNELQSILELSELPKRIEMFDISNLLGLFSVAAMVCYVDGKKKKSDYRKYKIKTVDSVDDYKSTMEVLYRRYSKKQETLPNLIIIDGGKGHQNAALDVLNALGLSIPVLSLIKDNTHSTSMLLYQDREINIKKTSLLFRFLSEIQEEVHRFAINYHRNIRAKGMMNSVLDSIEGVGPKRKRALLKNFGSIENIKKANYKEIHKKCNIPLKIAEKIENDLN